MTARIKSWLPLVALLMVALLAGMGCNSSIDDPSKSDNLVTVAGASPTETCVDVDGELIDENNDGTLQDPEERFYTGFNQTISFESRPRGQATGPFNDVIFTNVDISFEMGNGGPPDRTEGLTVTVPAGGIASHAMTTVPASDAASGDFTIGDKGWMDMVFRGEDVAGNKVTATGRFQVRVVNSCGG